MSLHPAPASHPAGLRLTRHQRRFTQFTRPVFPSPVASRMEREPSGFPLSFEPRRPEPDNARQGGDRPTEHGPETTLYDISRTSNPACLLVVCDLASHGVIRQRGYRTPHPLATAWLELRASARRQDPTCRQSWLDKGTRPDPLNRRLELAEGATSGRSAAAGRPAQGAHIETTHPSTPRRSTPS
jgi:hypothetical protein